MNEGLNQWGLNEWVMTKSMWMISKCKRQWWVNGCECGYVWISDEWWMNECDESNEWIWVVNE